MRIPTVHAVDRMGISNFQKLASFASKIRAAFACRARKEVINTKSATRPVGVFTLPIQKNEIYSAAKGKGII
jgi:hypothetical protein